jgi:hypothetical protein
MAYVEKITMKLLLVAILCDKKIARNESTPRRDPEHLHENGI